MGIALFQSPFLWECIMLHKTILITSAMGFIAFGFLCYMQGEYILTEINNVVCFEDVGFSNIWIPDLAILVMTAIASTLCLTLTIKEVSE
tara:strand:+ start:1028 stop:1297 length:270 start_codon:yes stop_codon:yes gene_type:complete